MPFDFVQRQEIIQIVRRLLTASAGGDAYVSDADLAAHAAEADAHHDTATEGPGIDLIDQQVGLGGDTILLYDSGGNPVAEYAATSAGLDLASAAATAGDVVLIPAVTIDGNHTLAAGVTYHGLGRRATVLTGQITLSNGTTLQGLSVTRTANDANTLIAVVGPSSGTAYVYDCDISALQAGAGVGYALYEQSGGELRHYYCRLSAQAGGADSNPIYALTGESTDETIVSTAGVGKVLSLWNGASNDAPPADWETPGFDDSAWSVPVLANVHTGTPVAGTDPIWKTADPVNPAEANIFRHSFVLPEGTVTAATLTTAADDVIDNRYLNGVAISDGSINAALFVPGASNLLAFKARTTMAVKAWLSYKLVVTYTPSSPGITGYGSEIPNAEGAVSITPTRGDRAAYDVTHYPNLHASDIEAGVFTRHLPDATGDDEGKIPTVQSDGTYKLDVPAVPDHEHSGTQYCYLTYVLLGPTDAIQAGQYLDLRSPAGTIVGWEMEADQSGGIVIDLRRCTYGDLPPDSAESLVGAGGTKPTLSSQQRNQDTTLTDWTTTLSEGDWVRAYVESASTVEQVTLSVKVRR